MLDGRPTRDQPVLVGYPDELDDDGHAHPDHDDDHAHPTATPTPTPTGPTPSDGTPLPARMSIPALKVTGLVVEPYQGFTDDAPGTLIQNRGLAASPHGPRGGIGPGGVGNFQVTAHRTTKPAPFRDLPAFADSALVLVDAGGVRYTYAITATRQTSFRSPASLAEQRAAIPGRPGVAPTSGDDHAVDLRDPGGPGRREPLGRRVRQPRAPHRQDRRPRPDLPRPGLAPRRPCSVLPMHELILWSGFFGAWLLVAGPLYQAALELGEQNISREDMAGVQRNEPEARPSGWWWRSLRSGTGSSGGSRRRSARP